MKFPLEWDASVASEMMRLPGGAPDKMLRLAAQLHTESNMDEWDIIVLIVDGIATVLGESEDPNADDPTVTVLNEVTRMLLALMNLSEETVV